MINNGLICKICGSSVIKAIRYDDHVKARPWQYIKHRMAAVIGSWNSLPARFSASLRARTLFGPSGNIHFCQSCGHGEYGRKFTDGELENYYRRAYFLAGGLEMENWDDESFIQSPKTQGQVAFMQPYLNTLPSNARVLDVGAGACRLGRLLRTKVDQITHLSAVEPGEGWTRYYQHHSIEHVGRFFPLEDKRAYDLVVSSHWLEHVEQLVPVMEGLRRCTLDGGLMFVEVPNCAPPYGDLDMIDSPHIHFFTAKSLTNLGEKHGFRLLRALPCGLPAKEYEAVRRGGHSTSSSISLDLPESERINQPEPTGHLLRAIFKAV
jgi:SAM-dependent methyltransferase